MRLLSVESERQLKELRESGQWCCIKITSNYDYVWEVCLVDSDQIETHKTTIWSGSCADLNTAIDIAYTSAQKYLAHKKTLGPHKTLSAEDFDALVEDLEKE